MIKIMIIITIALIPLSALGFLIYLNMEKEDNITSKKVTIVEDIIVVEEEVLTGISDKQFEDIKSHKVEFYKAKNTKDWYWRIKAKNGNTIGSSSEGYKNRIDCVYNAKSVSLSIMDYEEPNEDKDVDISRS